MPTITLTDQIEHVIDTAGKKNFVIQQLTSGGGNGDDSPPTLGGDDEIGSNGGAGGATLSNVPLSNETLTGAITITLSQEGSTELAACSEIITLSAGEWGSTHDNTGDRAEAGRVQGSLPSWVTDPETQYAEGAPAWSWEEWPGEETTNGLGGGSAGGVGGVTANEPNKSTGGVAPTAGVGAGATGGAGNGADGGYPGGGAAGAGAGAFTGGTGGGAKCILTYDDLDIAITSNGGGPAAEIEVTPEEAAVVITTVVASEDVDFPGVSYRINGGANADLFSLDPVTGELTFQSAPELGSYEVIVEAYQGSTVDSQTITITVSSPATTRPRSHGFRGGMQQFTGGFHRT